MKKTGFYLIVVLLAGCTGSRPVLTTITPVEQRAIPRVDKMPNHPQPYAYKDWRQAALDFDRVVFDFNQKGAYRPFIWLDGAKRNYPDTTFGFYTALGDVREEGALGQRDMQGRRGLGMLQEGLGEAPQERQGRNQAGIGDHAGLDGRQTPGTARLEPQDGRSPLPARMQGHAPPRGGRRGERGKNIGLDMHPA